METTNVSLDIQGSHYLAPIQTVSVQIHFLSTQILCYTQTILPHSQKHFILSHLYPFS